MNALRRSNPCLLADLVSAGADATRRCIRTRKSYAAAIGVSRQRASQHRNGDEHSPATRFLSQLAEAGNAWPMLGAGVGVVIRRTMAKMTKDMLWQRIEQINDEEHQAEASESLHTVRCAQNPTPEELIASAEADEREADLQYERAALKRTLARKMMEEA